ncbi:MAG: transglutaminase-like domain-containing protein [Oscillospiraceae bacterium]|nr:transglutaminase-like domain-containing protein [Oscillospiraceae bacterium]
MSLSAKATHLNATIKGALIGFAVRVAKRGSAKPDYFESDTPKQSGSVARHRFFTTLLQNDLFIDSLVTFFISSAINLTLMTLPYFSIGISPLTALSFTALSIIVFLILRLRPWFAPLLILSAAGIISLYHLNSGTLAERFYYWVELGTWIFIGFPEQEIIHQSSEWTIFTYLILFLVTLLIYFIMRHFYSIRLLIVAIFFFTAVFLAGGFIGRYLSLSLFIVGVIGLLPHTYFSRTKDRKKKRGKPSRPPAQLIAIPIAMLTVLLSISIFSPSGSYFRWRPLANIIDDISRLVSPASTEVTGSFDMHTLGFGISPDRLGGPVTLSDGYVLTVVSSAPDVPVLLSGAVMDYYTGYRWLHGDANNSLRFNSILWRDSRANSFDFNIPSGNSSVQDAFYSITEDITLSITYASEFYTTVFSNSAMRNISFASSVFNSDLRFNERSELYMPTPIPMGEAITVNARVINRSAPLFYDTILFLEGAVEEDFRYSAILERYTILPDSLPDIVPETALYVVGDETSPFLKATAIATWLGENFHYTLETVIPPDDVDFVAHFLETREGYCTYFATAMAVMARTVGLPSRYVIGFALFRDPLQNDIFYATGRTAHAWAEIYFYGLGWIPFDPLDWNPDMPPHSPFAFGGSWVYWYWDDYMAWGGVGDRFGYYELISLYEVPQSEINSTFIVAAVSVPLMILLIILIFFFIHKQRKYSLHHVLRKFPDLADRFGFYFSDIMRHLRALGIGIEPGETLTDYIKRIHVQVAAQGLNDDSLHTIARTQMRLNFAGLQPSSADIEIVKTFHIALIEKLRKSSTKKML